MLALGNPVPGWNQERTHLLALLLQVCTQNSRYPREGLRYEHTVQDRVPLINGGGGRYTLSSSCPPEGSAGPASDMVVIRTYPSRTFLLGATRKFTFIVPFAMAVDVKVAANPLVFQRFTPIPLKLPPDDRCSDSVSLGSTSFRNYSPT